MRAELWAEMKRLRDLEKLSFSEIARRVGCDRKTVRKAVAAGGLPVRRDPRVRPSKLDSFKGYIEERLRRYPHLAGTVLFEEIKRQGYQGKLRILGEYLADIRQRSREVFLRIETLPGEYAQVDWANCGGVRIGNALRKLSCFVMVLSYSRMMYLEFTLSQCLEDFIQCHLNAFRFFGGTPRKILYDNVKTVVVSRVGSSIRFCERFMEFAGIYLFEPIPCNPGRGNEKGKVESGIKYIRSSFLAGKELTLAWPGIRVDAFRWRDDVANVRLHGTIRQRPLDRFEKERPFLQALPEKAYDASLVRPVKTTSQALIHFDGNAYSVPCTLAYQTLLLKATFHEVRLFKDTRQVAIHRRSFERGVVVEDTKHYEGILATKRKAWASKIQDAFLAVGEPAQQYLHGLVQAELNLPHHLAQIMELLRLYGSTEVLQALTHALRFHAFGAAYLKNIIVQQRARRGIQEQLPIVIPGNPSWTKLAVEEVNLSSYDELCDQEQNHDDYSA